MERQIEKYFQEELNADERLDFLKQVESDNELKKQFIKFKNVRLGETEVTLKDFMVINQNEE